MKFSRLIPSQVHESLSSEPEDRTRIINSLNKLGAERHRGLCLRLPESGSGHCIFSTYSWTEDEAASYLANGTLPRDLATRDPENQAYSLWIFDARGFGGNLPEVEFEHGVPDFTQDTVRFIFDMGSGCHAWFPLKFFKTVPVGPNKVRFVKNEERMRESGVKGWMGKHGEEDVANGEDRGEKGKGGGEDGKDVGKDAGEKEGLADEKDKQTKT